MKGSSYTTASSRRGIYMMYRPVKRLCTPEGPQVRVTTSNVIGCLQITLVRQEFPTDGCLESGLQAVVIATVAVHPTLPYRPTAKPV